MRKLLFGLALIGVASCGGPVTAEQGPPRFTQEHTDVDFVYFLRDNVTHTCAVVVYYEGPAIKEWPCGN